MVPALVLILTLEDRRPRFVTLASEAEEDRLRDWLASCPLGDLVDRAMELQRESERD